MCFGAEAAPYRVELFPAYHADRPPVPDALAWQFSHAPELFSAFGWGVESSDEVEADDLLGSLAAVEADAGGRALIVTGDRDMYQCVSGEVSVLFLKSGITGFTEVDPAEVRAPVRGRAGARARLHRSAGRSVGRAAGRAGDRAEDRGRRSGAVRVARRRHCRRRRRAAEGGGGVEGVGVASCGRSGTSRRCGRFPWTGRRIGRPIWRVALRRRGSWGCGGWRSGSRTPATSASCSGRANVTLGAAAVANATVGRHERGERDTSASDERGERHACDFAATRRPGRRVWVAPDGAIYGVNRTVITSPSATT